MSMPKDERQREMIEAWRAYLDALEKSLNQIESDINQAAQVADTCTNEWCQAAEHTIDQIGDALFSISEPRWAEPEDSRRIKALKKRVHDLYADYREVYRSIGR